MGELKLPAQHLTHSIYEMVARLVINITISMTVFTTSNTCKDPETGLTGSQLHKDPQDGPAFPHQLRLALWEEPGDSLLSGSKEQKVGK